MLRIHSGRYRPPCAQSFSLSEASPGGTHREHACASRFHVYAQTETSTVEAFGISDRGPIPEGTPKKAPPATVWPMCFLGGGFPGGKIQICDTHIERSPTTVENAEPILRGPLVSVWEFAS